MVLMEYLVVLPLRIIFGNILSTATYPDIWKLSNVTPIFKKGDKQLIGNYRPTSLLPLCGKIFEKIIINILYKHLTPHHLITKNQSGFRPGDSTTNQLIDLVDEIHQAFDSKVWHDGLIFKMKQNGITGNLLKLFHNYLSNRKQRVVLNGFSYDYSSIDSGVPQGSVLGLLFFLNYIIDLEKNIKSNVNCFVDDTMLFSVVNSPAISAYELNHDVIVMSQWAYQ